jgi:hypothetical protein
MRVLGDRKDFDSVFSSLNKNSSLFKDVHGVIENLKNDIVTGERIKYEKIPKYYKKRHDIDNAFHVYLPEGMRLIYSITNYQGKKTAFLMELADHKKYEQRFKY